jgi:hypothetical protein
MKKIITILVLIMASTAFAENGIEFEYGSEKGTNAPNINGTKVTNNYFAVTPFTEIDGYTVGLKLEGARDDIPNASLENKVELQVSHKVFQLGKLKGKLKVGIGEDFNQQDPTTSPDFAYYMVQPQVAYELTHGLALEASYRYRNAFSSGHYFESNTAKIGVSYEIGKYELGLRYVNKFGFDSHANGIEGGITYSF